MSTPRSAAVPVHPAVPNREVVPWPPVVTHVAVVLALTWALVAPVLLGCWSEAALGLVVPVAQWFPALVSIATNLVWRRGRLRDLWAVRKDKEGRVGVALLAAVVAMALVPLVQVGLGVALGLTAWAPRVNALLVLAAVPVVLVVQGLFGAGEELGWRGYLYRLLRPLGFWGVAVITALVWTLWHVPAALATWKFGASPHAAWLYLLDILVIGVVFASVRRLGGSIWPVVVAHALLNSARVYVMQNLTTPEDLLPVRSLWAFHALGWVLFAATAVVVARLARPASERPAAR